MFREDAPPRAPKAPRADDIDMETFRIEVGHVHGVQPGNIVGAIANEADLESRYIGRIDIRDDYSLVDLPEGMPRELMEHLKKVRIAGRPLRMQRATEADNSPSMERRPFAPRKPGGFKPGGKPGGKPGFKPGGKPGGKPRFDKPRS